MHPLQVHSSNLLVLYITVKVSIWCCSFLYSRPSRNEEREMNTETFGVSSVRGYGNRGYRRGRGRGGRGRGGGYYRGRGGR